MGDKTRTAPAATGAATADGAGRSRQPHSSTVDAQLSSAEVKNSGTATFLDSTQSEHYHRLARFFTTPGPGDPPRDPADLGDPALYNGLGKYVRSLQRGTDPDEVLSLMTPEHKAELWKADPEADLDAELRAQLAERWQVLGIADLLRPPRPAEYLVGDMIRHPALVCPFGSPGDLKSMLFMDLAVCVAAGAPWLEPLPGPGKGGAYQVKQSSVLWFDQDNGANRLQERFGALCRARGITAAPLHAISLPRPVYDVSDPLEADLLVAQIRELGALAVFIDNLGTISGGRDENSGEMVGVMGNLRWIAEATGAALFIIHHARKSGPQANGREGDRLRGHSSIEASLDLALLIEREQDDVTVSSTKTRDDPVDPFVAHWTFEKAEDGALLTARFWHLNKAELNVSPHITVAMNLADLVRGLEQAPNQSRLVQEIATAFTMQRKSALKAIHYAVTHGWLVEEQQGVGKTSPKVYRAT